MRIIGLSLALLLGLATRAMACVCVEAGSVDDQVRRARTVVVGRVVALTLESHEVNGATVEYTAATVKIERRWKSPEQPTVRVTTCGDQSMVCTCGFDFRLGGRYLVVTEDDTSVSSCGLSAYYSESDPTIDQIEEVLGESR